MERQARVTLDFTKDPEMFEAINKYRRSMGWTWKRFVLTGMAEAIKDNPDLVLMLVEYLGGER